MRRISIVTLFLALIQGPSAFAKKMSVEEQNVELIKNMFIETAEKMNIAKIDEYFSPDFEMWSNDVHWNFKQYKVYHAKIFKESRKATKIKWPLDDIFAKGDRVAAKVTITLLEKNDQKKDIQVMLIAQIKNNKIHRLWELTFPHWN